MKTPTESGLYEMHWTHGTPEMLEWKRAAVYATARGLVVETDRGMVPIGQFHGAEWGAHIEEDMMTSDKIKMDKPESDGAKRRRRRGEAVKLEARIYDVRDALAKISAALDNDDIEGAKRATAWVRIIADGGDREAWYRSQLGL